MWTTSTFSAAGVSDLRSTWAGKDKSYKMDESLELGDYYVRRDF